MNGYQSCCGLSLALSILFGNVVFAEPTPLKIGLIAPVSGELSLYGTAALEGLTLANERLPGQPAKILVENNQSCGPSDAVTGAQKLVNIDKVDIVVTVCTGAAQGVLPIVKAHNIPLFQITESGPDPEKYMIKLMPDAVGLVDVLAEKYVKHFPNLALIGASIQVNSGDRGNLTLFRKKFESLGGKISYYEEFPSDVLDFRTTIERIRRSGAQAVLPFLAPAKQMAAFLKQADEMQLWKNISLAGNFFFEFMLKELVALYPNLRKLEGLESSNLAQETAPGFIADFKAKYAKAPPQFADYAYDAMTIIKRCALKSSCYREPFEGVSGPVKFDSETDRRIGKFVSKVFKNGEFVVEG
jgi:branched-chain amino acid transport system substrate-binding protein